MGEGYEPERTKYKDQERNPSYSVTMYQDVHPALVRRNYDADQRILCVGDFSENMIGIARGKFHQENRSFYVRTTNDLKNVLEANQKGKFNRILLIGILMYINDKDLISVMNQLTEVSEEQAVICIREPLGIDERLTLKGFYSEELKDNYNAIYRTRDELMQVFDKTLLQAGFKVTQSGFLFSEDELNNRKETAQYYFILER